MTPEEQEHHAKEQRAQIERAEALLKAPPPVIVAPKPIPVAGVAYVRRTPAYRIVDKNKIPDGYWMLDTEKIFDEVKAMADAVDIPGIEFYWHEKVVERSKVLS